MADKQAGPTVYTALIMPLSSHASFPKPRPPGTPGQPQPPGGGGQPGAPDQTLPGDLPRPEHPIFFPLPPGAPVDPDYGLPSERPDQGLPGAQPRPDQGLPGSQPRPDQGLPGSQPHPEHPIAGTGNRPDQGLPGAQPRPEHPIVLPPDSGGWVPIYIWGGGNEPMPTPPIHLPPDGSAPDEGEGAEIKFKAVWTPSNGWQTVGVIVPGGEHVSPSKKK